MTSGRSFIGFVATTTLAIVACGGGGDPPTAASGAAGTIAVGAVATTTIATAPAAGATLAPSAAATAAPTPVPTTTTAPPPPPTMPATTAPPPPAPCQVVFVGDSVGTGIANQGLDTALAGVGCGLAWKGGYPGITVTDGANALAGAGAVPANVAVVVLGYHNARSETRNGHFPGLIDHVMESAGPRTVIWPLLAQTPDCSATYTDAVADADAELQAATARWPNLVLVDYPSLLGAHPEWSENRCPHLLAPGYRATAEWLASEVRRVVDAAPPA